MSGVITVGGLATGIDSNSIIQQLVALQQRPIDLLNQQIASIQQSQGALTTFGSKLATLKSAALDLSTTDGVLVRSAASSDETVLTAAAGSGAQRGSVDVTVSQLARGSVASSTVGVASATSTVAAGTGTFRFQVGGGTVYSVPVDGTTTLQGLADAINALGAGVSASAINVGTAAAPDYRLHVASQATGASSTITVVQDDTALGIETSQAGLNAKFTVSGFNTTFQRESNTFSDVLTGVTISLRSQGTSTVTVSDDADAVVAKVQTLISAYNDLQSFVSSNSTVSESSDKTTLTSGPLAGDSTVQLALGSIQGVLTGIANAGGAYVNLSSLGLATQNDGTLTLDQNKFRDALAANPNAVAAVFAGPEGSSGVSNSLQDLIGRLTQPGGALSAHSQALNERIGSLQQTIDIDQQSLDAYEQNLRTEFTALETFVTGLQLQSGALASLLQSSSPSSGSSSTSSSASSSSTSSSSSSPTG
jgi:flagellar hook-associated protein 2